MISVQLAYREIEWTVKNARMQRSGVPDNLALGHFSERSATHRIDESLDMPSRLAAKVRVSVAESVLKTNIRQVQRTIKAFHKFEVPMVVDDLRSEFSSLLYRRSFAGGGCGRTINSRERDRIIKVSVTDGVSAWSRRSGVIDGAV